MLLEEIVPAGKVYAFILLNLFTYTSKIDMYNFKQGKR